MEGRGAAGVQKQNLAGPWNKSHHLIVVLRT